MKARTAFLGRPVLCATHTLIWLNPPGKLVFTRNSEIVHFQKNTIFCYFILKFDAESDENIFRSLGVIKGQKSGFFKVGHVTYISEGNFTGIPMTAFSGH